MTETRTVSLRVESLTSRLEELRTTLGPELCSQVSRSIQANSIMGQQVTPLNFQELMVNALASIDITRDVFRNLQDVNESDSEDEEPSRPNHYVWNGSPLFCPRTIVYLILQSNMRGIIGAVVHRASLR
jgi:hypothetical protein